MQGTGYVIVKGRKILVLVWDGKTARWLKMRTTGTDGGHFTEEEAYLSDNPQQVKRLLMGQTIVC